MYLHSVTVCFIATFFSIHGGPVSKPVNDFITNADDTNYKCPYVRISKFLHPPPKFLSKCVDLRAPQSLTALDVNNVEDSLCLLFYDNLEHLCYRSNNYSEIAERLLSNDQIDQISTAYQNVSHVCEVLKNTPNFNKNYKPVIEVLRSHFEDSRKCEHICADWDLITKPICSVTATMLNATIKLDEEIQNLVPDTRNERTKSKPPLTDHNNAVSNTQNVANKQSDESGVSHPVMSAAPLQNGQLVVQSSNTSKLPALNQTSLNGSTMLSAEENSNGDQQNEQSTATNIKTVGETLIKLQSEKPGEQSRGVVVQTTSVGTPKNSANEGEVPVNAPTEPKSVLEINNNPSTGSKTNIVDVQKPGASSPPLFDEINGSGIEAKKETPDGNNNENGDKVNDDKINGDKINEELPNEDLTKSDQNNKSSTKEGGVEVAGEPPLDAKEQFDDDLNGDIDQEVDQEDYNDPNDLPPKSSKTVQLEKSKPLETDEDGPSFAANYQNQSIDDSDSYFFSYFMMVCIMFICGYVAYHNKQKILALVVEGRKGRRTSRTRRPNSANYRKLDSNLEEAVTSSCNKNATQVIY